MKNILLLLIIIVFSSFIISCDNNIEEPCQEFKITYLDNKCEVCQTCEEQSNIECPKCPEVEGCPKCNKCDNSDIETEVKILRAEKDYEWGLYFQNKVNNTLKDLDKFMLHEQYNNCSRILSEAIEDIETANSFYMLSGKKFKKIDDNIALIYYNATLAYIEYNKDYIEYLFSYRTFCNKYDDGESNIDEDYMDEHGLRWLDRAKIHFYEYEYNIRLVGELR